VCAAGAKRQGNRKLAGNELSGPSAGLRAYFLQLPSQKLLLSEAKGGCSSITSLSAAAGERGL